MKYTTLLLSLLLASFILSCSQETRKNPRDLNNEQKKIDEIIWNASFSDLDGNEVSIQDYKGKVVDSDFW